MSMLEVVIYKIITLLVSFLSVLVLTKLPSSEGQVMFASSYLVVIPILSLINTYLFFSDFTIAAENGETVESYSMSLFFSITTMLLLIFSYIFFLDYKEILLALVVGGVCMVVLYMDNFIIMLDSGGGSRRIEILRVFAKILYFGLLCLVISFGLELPNSEYVYKMAVFIIFGLCLAFLIYYVVMNRNVIILKMNIYKMSLLFGNLFWLLPRLLFNVTGLSTEVLQLSFLQSVGLAFQQLLNMFYGRMIGFVRKYEVIFRKFMWALWVFIVFAGIPIGFLVGEEYREFVVMGVYALATLAQVLSRSRVVNRVGNSGASIAYMESLLFAIPIVILSVFVGGDSIWVMLGLILVLVIRVLLYEKGPVFKRYL